MYPLKQYPFIGACGLDCGLCPRYHTVGSSRCPGCAGEDFEQKHPPCAFVTCCVKKKHLETCAQCPDWNTCERMRRVFEEAQQSDSFISYRPLANNFAFIHKYGIEKFAQQEMARMEFLKYLLENYDEGRSKAFYCISCQLLPLDSLKAILAGLKLEKNEKVDIRIKASLIRTEFNRLAETLQIDLKLRK